MFSAPRALASRLWGTEFLARGFGGCRSFSARSSRGGTEVDGETALAPQGARAERRPVPAGRSLRAPARDAVPDLDRLIHERFRLAIVSALAANEALSFRELKALLDATDGNLSVHARKLENAGYVACRKTFDGPGAENGIPVDRSGPARVREIPRPPRGSRREPRGR